MADKLNKKELKKVSGGAYDPTLTKKENNPRCWSKDPNLSPAFKDSDLTVMCGFPFSKDDDKQPEPTPGEIKVK